jgi:hypothetical protein
MIKWAYITLVERAYITLVETVSAAQTLSTQVQLRAAQQ